MHLIIWGGNYISDKKIVVIFPGGNYSADCPLLYYAGVKFEDRGYEKVTISYGDLIKQSKSLEECIGGIKRCSSSLLNR